MVSLAKIVRNIRPIILLALGALTAVIWYGVAIAEANRLLRMTFFDVGQGDAIFIETPAGNQVLIDGGTDNRILAKLGETMPFWDRSLDMVILTHPHADHVAGLLDVLKRYDVGMALESGVNYTTPEYAAWRRLLAEKHIPVVRALAGERAVLGGGSVLDVLAPLRSFTGENPKNIHDAMIVLRLAYASSSVLLAGDAEAPLEYQLVSAGTVLKSDILKVGHHGSKTSTSEIFVRAVAPGFAVISLGRNNRYGHPHHLTLAVLERLAIPVFRTDTDGDVIAVSDGARFTVSAAARKTKLPPR